jgi:hypothetical protein
MTEIGKKVTFYGKNGKEYDGKISKYFSFG